jgi:cytochrome c biogenesis protein CcmG/thiol:disulfide interchange protein DsbE
MEPMEIATFVDMTAPQPPQRQFSWGTVFLMAGILAITAVVGIAFARQNANLSIGKPAPNFTVTTFDGEELSLSDLKGQVVVVNFWASWCAPCHDEAPELQYIHETYQNAGVVLVGITYAESNIQNSIDFIERYGITYINAPDRGTRISKQYGITGVPETFIIDREGNLSQYYPGPVDANLLGQFLDSALNQS